MSTPSIDRLVASRGPALVSFNGGSFLSKDDIVVDLSKDTKALPSSAFGDLTEINMGVKASTKFTPVGEFESLGVLWPYAATPVGRSIFGNADVPLLIQPIDNTQKQVRFWAAAVSKMPDINFTATDTLIGEVEFQMVGKNATAVDDPARMFQFENNAIGAIPYDDSKLIVQPYSVSWLSAGTYHPSYNAVASTAALAYNAAAAAVQTQLRTVAALANATVTGDYQSGFTVANPDGLTANFFTSTFAGFPGGYSLRATQIDAHTVLLQLWPFANFPTREGIKVAFNLSLTEDTSDAIGHYDTIFRGLTVTAIGIPQGVAEADALTAAAIQGSGSVRGTRLSSGAHNLDISGAGVYFRLYAAAIRKAGLVYSSQNQRVPAIEWAASRSIGGGGVINPLFAIDVNPIA